MIHHRRQVRTPLIVALLSIGSLLACDKKEEKKDDKKADKADHKTDIKKKPIEVHVDSSGPRPGSAISASPLDETVGVDKDDKGDTGDDGKETD